jgi:hypothetical protein
MSAIANAGKPILKPTPIAILSLLESPFSLTEGRVVSVSRRGNVGVSYCVVIDGEFLFGVDSDVYDACSVSVGTIDGSMGAVWLVSVDRRDIVVSVSICVVIDNEFLGTDSDVDDDGTIAVSVLGVELATDFASATDTKSSWVTAILYPFELQIIFAVPQTVVTSLGQFNPIHLAHPSNSVPLLQMQTSPIWAHGFS